MDIHEHQAKDVLRQFGIPVPQGFVAFSAAEAVEAAKKLTTERYVVKAQIHAGGRGKAGGVKLVATLDEVKAAAEKMLGMTLVTHQTGPEGKLVRRLYIEEASAIAKEFYLSAVVDRATGGVTFIASSEGGMDIEEVAHNTPEKIAKVSLDPLVGYRAFHGLRLAKALGLDAERTKLFVQFVKQLHQAVIDTDASQVEINPLVLTADGKLIALDAKCNFDDNALFRHPDILALRDETEEDPLELRAAKSSLNYVKMQGNIGCMVNGAGLAMATMDIIKLHGGEPANFLDVGGGATKERVTEAFKIILSDSNVKGILVNIFGGIMRCDIIAEGVVAAAKEVSLQVPLVVRLAGTNVELGKEILSKSSLNIISADDLGDAAAKVVQALKGA